MFNLDDVWSIMDYLKDVRSDNLNETDTADSNNLDLDERLRILARSEALVTDRMFSNSLDQVCFDTADYERLRNMLVDWYSSHKILTSTQRYCTDLYRMPEDQLDELFASFGINIGLDTKTVPYFENKVALFLDLVNLYRKKGTPYALKQILEYYGFRSPIISEYWLRKNSAGELVFRGEDALSVVTEDPEEISFVEMTEDDPHWMMTEAQVEAAISANKIHLPTKSPYFSLLSRISLQDLTALMSIMTRIVGEQFRIWQSTGTLPNVIEIGNRTEANGNAFERIPVYRLLEKNQPVHLLEIYLAIIYCMNKLSETT